jgi:ubiquinone/menaquinone biosynthesis C-methylase UbiE
MSDASRFDSEAVRRTWDRAADSYATGQASGLDHYRYAFFGPAQVEICGDVHGLKLLDVGCGSGYFAREMAKRGARVAAIDISSRMIELARRVESEFPLGIEYQVADAVDLPTLYPAASFDMATSCVALQDMPRVDRVFAAARELLRPNGRFVASITHPCTDTPFRQWERDGSGRKRWLCIDRYFDHAILDVGWPRWPEAFSTMALHAPLEDWFAWILAAGFTVRGFREPRPNGDALRQRPDLEDATRVPYYVVFDLIREGA